MLQRLHKMYTLLVIEDDDDIRYSICDILELSKYRVMSASSGRKGLEIARQQIPDLILSDVQMPEMDGYEVLDAIRQDPKLTLISFIFLTSLADHQYLRKGMLWGADDYLTKPLNGEELLEAISVQLSKKEKVNQHYQNIAQNIAQEKLENLLYFDPLTQLPNRLALRERLDRAISNTSQEVPIPILLIDIDRFGVINDSRGEEFGDLLLQAIAKRIIDIVQDDDTICRLSGDEFAIILSTANPKFEAKYVANSLLDSFADPFIVRLTEVYVTASIGISLHSQDTSGIMQQANLALQEAKRHGGNCYQFFDEIQVKLPLRLELQTDLHYALDNQEFELYYQPQVSIATGEMFGSESLIRWNHSSEGLISPMKFIPITESNGSIIEIGEWILRTACQQVKAAQTLISQNALHNTNDVLQSISSLKVSVNLSGRQFQQHNLNKRILDILEEMQFDPQYLELEITETTVVHNIDASLTKLKELKDLGVKLSIDDFGTGFSSLSYIKKFPLDTLKIDRCFVQHIDTDSQNRAIAKAIITMAKSLNFKTVAEGVETHGELKVLQDLGCDGIQGYYYSRPLPFDKFCNFVTKGNRL